MSENLGKIVKSFQNQKILVVGDLVLDQFLYGEIARISREAPVIILRHKHTTNAPGGGGNASRNLKTLGAGVVPIGAIANDESGKTLLQLFHESQIPTEGLLKLSGSPTPTKTRIMGGLAHSSPQQIVRVDRDNTGELSSRDQKRICESIEIHIEGCSGAIISDYGYGVVTESVVDSLREHCLERNIPIVVDSRFRLRWFHNITAITPNITEVEESFAKKLDGDPEGLEKCAADIVQEQSLKALLVTRGKFGMSLLEKGHAMKHIPVYGSDQVADVTGAGDTVIATFTLALASGASFLQAARLSNFAGGIVVMKRGTATVSQVELQRSVGEGSLL